MGKNKKPCKEIIPILRILEESESRNGAVLQKSFRVTLGGLQYVVNTSSTTNSDIVIEWVKRNILGIQCVHQITVVEHRGDLLLGLMRDMEVLVYQLQQEGGIPKRLTEFINDEPNLKFSSFGVSANLSSTLKTMGFNLSIFKAKTIKNVQQEVIALEKLISSKEEEPTDYEERGTMQENSVILVALHLLRSTFVTE